MDFRGVAPLGAMFAGQDCGDVVQSDGGGDKGTWVDGAGGVKLNGAGDAAGGAEHADGGDVLERENAGVEVAGFAGEPDIDDPARPGSTRSAARAGRTAAFEASMTAS